MSTFLSELGGITAGVGAEGLAFAAGFAASHALEPEAVTIRQDAWHGAQVLRIPPDLAAMIASENIAAYADMQTEATYSGWEESRFAYLYHLNLVAPGMGELLNMLRRQTINSGNFTHGLRKNKYEPMWDDALAELANQYISATDLAYMMVRGVLPDEGLLGMSLPTQADKLQLPPQYSIDPVVEASKTGWDKERLGAMVARSGLAMAPVMAAQAYFRGILSANDYLLTIARGDLFPAYAEPVREVSRAIPSPTDYSEGWLRGWITLQQAYAGAARHGMIPADLDLVREVRRRGLSPHQVKQALARGATFNTAEAPLDDPYLASVHEANLGPEWYDMAIALQGSYPSLFITNRLVTSNIITAADGEDWLKKSGMADEVVTALHASWTGGTTATADKNITSAETHLKTATHKSYIAYEIADSTATTALESAGVAAASVQPILTLWQAERDLIRKSLTAANIKKALADGLTNPATGVAWTQADAIARLLELGYNNADATTYLEL